MILVAAIMIGAIIMMAGINDQLSRLGSLTKDLISPQDGSSGFLIWVFAILFIGALLRMLDLPEAGKALIVLVIIAYLLGHRDIPNQILESIKSVGGGAGTEPAANANSSK